ncbi:transmembrane protein 104-like [Orbicella faveolata]|uniref:transmembrane protein 104-like n=1 Tax=Orbicella faveolata TaxID=48498 RepID=UPI0009E21BFB|nr:transmembrane protein 104-like [Orbicella faveolata]
MVAVTETGSLYSSTVAFIYVFNLIIGVGALTMPKAFSNAGWMVAIVLTGVLCFMRLVRDRGPAVFLTVFLAFFYSIRMPFYLVGVPNYVNVVGVRLFYICTALYLYGDLAIYAAAVPKSLTQVACGSLSGNDSSSSFDTTEPCWNSLTQISVYRIFLVSVLVLGPFTFFNVQKTKYLQMFTTAMRWIAFMMMIVLALVKIGKGKGKHDTPPANFSGLPNLFGVCVYSYMCQHSLPSLITPMKNKSRITLLFSTDFAVVMVFYALLSFTAIFTFRAEDLKDLYTLNFWDSSGKFVGYFLALFPVFTLSTNFPIISITLRDNLKNLFHREGRPYPWVVDRIAFPLATITLPIIVAFITQNLEILVGVTGSYAGAGVQYIIPACLAFYGKKHVMTMTGCYDNKHRSPFGRLLWILFVVGWAFVCIAFVTANHIITKK